MKKPLILILILIMLLQSVPSIAKINELTIEGTIEVIDIINRQITVLDWDNKLHTINIPKDIKTSDLYFGQEVIAKIKDKSTLKLELIQEEDPTRDGYIAPGTRYRLGTVLFASNTEIEIITTKTREKYEIDPFSTTLYKRGMVAELRQLKEGDRVLLTFDDIYSSTVSEIKIEDDEKHIAGVLKGKIEIVDTRNKEILISEPMVLNGGQWTPTTPKTKIKLGTGQIYEGGKKITLANLQKRKGLDIYIAYENNFGRQAIGKALIKAGPSMEYKDLLQDIDYGIGQMVVNTNMFSFHQGTIVIRNNRLVDSLNLNKYQEVYLVSDYKNGLRQASVVSIEGTSILEDRIDNSRLLVHKGRIRDILDYKLISDHEEFIFTEDTYIYDSELKIHIPTKTFQNSKYIDLIDIRHRDLRNRLAKDYYKNKPAYIIARETELGKEILSINLIPQEDNNYDERVNLDYNTLGEIKSIDQENLKVELINVNNLNTLTNRWEKSTNEIIDLSKAIIIENDKPIPLEELYKIRLRSKAYLVRQKQSSTSTTYILLIED